MGNVPTWRLPSGLEGIWRQTHKYRLLPGYHGYRCVLQCRQPGPFTEEFNPPEEMRSYSHALNNSLPGYGFACSRLDSTLAWSGQILDGTKWMIMDFGAPRAVAAIVVQGSASASDSQWVSEYRVEFSNGVQRSDEGFTWTTVMASVSGTEAFAGPTSRNDRFEAKLKRATEGRY